MTPPARKPDNYQLLRVYTYYRTILGCVMLMLYSGEFIKDALGTLSSDVFLGTASAYTLFNFATLISLWLRRNEPKTREIVFYLIIDVAAITLMSGSSGGLASGLPYLLIITVAAGAIFLNRQLAIFVAALATVAILTETVISSWMFGSTSSQAFSAGTLGILLFATALLFQYLTDRLRESSEEADLQAQEAAKARDISQKIIERMRTGVIVAGPDERVQLINNAARSLLGMDETPSSPLHLFDIPIVAAAYSHWQNHPAAAKPPIKVPDTNGEVRVNFANLGPDDEGDTLVFIEDHRLLAQEAQKLKLGSLGKLTASIAHEIRNPLGAIAHAAQLLTESPELSPESQKLLGIVLNHSQRVNQIIENTQQLSRRNQGQAEVIDLSRWLTTFINEYQLAFDQEQKPDIELISEADTNQPVLAKIDTNHLKQILTNLFDNGLRYSFLSTQRYHLTLQLGYRAETELVRLLVIDDGPGIDPELEDSIFEPFFTTENSGSGLGLYISRELCQSNQASLSFCRWQGKSCFQINFAHPQQVF